MVSVEALCVFWLCLVLVYPQVLLVIVYIVVSPFVLVIELLCRWSDYRESIRFEKSRQSRKERYFDLKARIGESLYIAIRSGKKPVGIRLDHETSEFVYQCQADWFERLENPAKFCGLTIRRARLKDENLAFIYE